MAVVMTKNELANALESIGIADADEAANGLIYLGMVKVISSPLADAMSTLGFAPFQARALENELKKRELEVAKSTHPHLANALERAREWASSDRLNTEDARYEAVRLLLDIAKASK